MYINDMVAKNLETTEHVKYLEEVWDEAQPCKMHLWDPC